MLFLILETYVSNGQLRNSDLSGLETDGMRANLIAESDENKGQLSNRVAYSRKAYANVIQAFECSIEKLSTKGLCISLLWLCRKKRIRQPTTDNKKNALTTPIYTI